MYHTIIIVGNLGRDPEMRYTPNGLAVTNMSVAANRQYTASNGTQVKETIWFRVSTWGRMAEVCNQYLRKGNKVLIEGRLIPDSATGGPRTFTRQDGTVGTAFEINANTIRFLSNKNNDDEDEVVDYKNEQVKTPVGSDPWEDISTDIPPWE